MHVGCVHSISSADLSCVESPMSKAIGQPMVDLLSALSTEVPLGMVPAACCASCCGLQTWLPSHSKSNSSAPIIRCIPNLLCLSVTRPETMWKVCLLGGQCPPIDRRNVHIGCVGCVQSKSSADEGRTVAAEQVRGLEAEIRQLRQAIQVGLLVRMHRSCA